MNNISNSRVIHIRCPYCGTEARHLVPFKQYAEQIVTSCDPEEGGCDRYFALAIDWVPRTTVFKMTEVK